MPGKKVVPLRIRLQKARSTDEEVTSGGLTAQESELTSEGQTEDSASEARTRGFHRIKLGTFYQGCAHTSFLAGKRKVKAATPEPAAKRRKLVPRNLRRASSQLQSGQLEAESSSRTTSDQDEGKSGESLGVCNIAYACVLILSFISQSSQSHPCQTGRGKRSPFPRKTSPPDTI